MLRAPRRTLQAQLLYFWVLLRRFKLTFYQALRDRMGRAA